MNPRRLLLATLFAAAMGYLESAVVVYLRLLYYPRGFDFPLVPLPASIVGIEVAREAATLVMLVTAGALIGRTAWSRFGWLCFLFGAWDLVFYAGLKIALGWPASLLTWDILFLIPVTWTGPVLAPVITSLALIGGGLCIVHFEEERAEHVQVLALDWVFVAASLALQLAAYTANHDRVAGGGLPGAFPWAIFLTGVALGVGTLVKALARNPRVDAARPRHSRP